MLNRLFSTPQQHRRYALTVSLGLAAYLSLGFIAVKWLFLGEVVWPSIAALALLLGAAAIFAFIHVASMRQLDSVPKRPDAQA